MNAAPGYSGDYGYKTDTVANQIGLWCLFRTPHKQDGETQHFDHLERSKLEQPVLILNLI